MAKKQKSFADKASGNKNKDSVYVKYIKSMKHESSSHPATLYTWKSVKYIKIFKYGIRTYNDGSRYIL